MASGRLPFLVATVIATIKIAIPFTYFAWFFDGKWTLSDDLNYIAWGQELVRAGYTPITALIEPEGLKLLFSVSGGQHILYTWWNLVGQYFFGDHYYSSVFLNIALTFICGLLLFEILRALNFSHSYRILFFIFFLFHWDVIAWSSFVNLKEIMVQTLTLSGLLFFVRISQRFSMPSLIGLIASLFLLLWIRFYIPIFILASFGAWVLFSRPKKILKYYLLITPLVIAFFSLSGKLGALSLLQPKIILGGLIRFILTPQPWNIEPSYSFLTIPSIFHWLFTIPSIIAFFFLWRRHDQTRLLLIYGIVVSLFYSILPEYQGPRHRVQLGFMLAWIQFHFLWIALQAFALHANAQSIINGHAPQPRHS